MSVETILKAKGHTVETVRPNDELQLVLHKLTTLGIGALVVTADGRHVDGTISERDIVRAIKKHGPAFFELQVHDVMTPGCPTCNPSDHLTTVMAVMTSTRHRHLPVVDRSGALVGIVSIGDVVKLRLEEMKLEADVLRDAYIAHL
jgi:predicted transcriptional regulator